MTNRSGQRNGIWVLALFLGLAGFVIWDQTRGNGEDPAAGSPAVTGAAPEAGRPARTPPPARETEAADESASDASPAKSGVM